MNYKGAILNELYGLIEEFPEYTMGQILHSITRPSMINGKSLYEVSDQEIYNAIENVKLVEQE